MEQSKLFYESSTRQLVNILESLSSQLPGPCTTRHYEDTDSFDSVLSRRSSDHSSLIREENNIIIRPPAILRHSLFDFVDIQIPDNDPQCQQAE